MHRRLSLAGGQPTHVKDPAHHVEVFAIQALDDLTGHLIQQHKFGVPPDFLDWIGQEATNLTRQVVRRYIDSAGDDAAHNPSRAEITILRLVYQTVTPMIKARFVMASTTWQSAPQSSASMDRRAPLAMVMSR